MKLADLKRLKERHINMIPKEQLKERKDDKIAPYAYFKLVGGPYHGNIVRMYAPWDELVYDDGKVIYQVHPPIGASDMWVYVHQGYMGEQE